MTNIKRGLRNTWRNRTRTVMVTLLLGISCALALTMLTASTALDLEIASVEAGVGTLIEIAAPGGAGRVLTLDAPLDQALVEVVEATPGIASAHPYVMVSMLRRGGMGSFFGGGAGQMPTAETRAAPRTIFGVQPGDSLLVPGGGTVEVIAGRGFEPADDGAALVLINEGYAQISGRVPGDVVVLDEIEFTVAGVFASEQMFANRAVFMPLGTLQALYDMEGYLTHIYAFAENIGAVDSAKAALVATLGEQAEVSAQKDAMAGGLEESLGGIKAAIRTTLLLSLAVSGIVVFFVMMMAVRERATEIGVLKAIGAARSDIVAQFATEATSLGLTGALAGVAGFLLGGRALGMSLLQRVAGAAPAADPALGDRISRFPGMGAEGWSIDAMREALGQFGAGGGFGFPGAGMHGGGLGISVGGLDTVLTWQALGIIAGLACLLGLLGGLLPALYAASMKPAEVLRRG